ncbi:cytochrome P450 [Nonomuraea sp. WAC 01424]|uniref:cytochrome P450 n=1 Tax=Nonomuraea sp. WAC 01424 TaxID=2203200 RepID=UPI000F7705C9|nr:cytochrome P450 [Nonomuraea sp. WAC 01424]RSM98625.1 cytochrome P450 [Nonomuraea sp. WAC 01424]
MTESSAVPLHMRRVEFNPAPELGEVRDQERVKRIDVLLGLEAWMVTRYADVREVLGDAERFKLARQGAARMPGAPELTEEQLAELRAGNLLGQDPPEHTRLRRMLTPEFTIRRMRRLEPRIRDIVDEHLDAMEAAGSPADLVSSFALPIPSLVICELLGVPYEDRADFQSRTGRMLNLALPVEERIAANFESRAYMRELVTRMRTDPGEDLLGMLIREHGDDLTTSELVGIGNLLLLAGHETTSNMLSLGTLALLRRTEQLELLRKEPERIDATVEELLRWLSIVHSGTIKYTTTEVELGGQTIGAGEMVLCSLPAANRDPGFIDDPDTLDITRGAPGHVAFGHGVHHCLGAPLARMEMKIAFPALFARFPGLRVTDATPEFRSYNVVYGLTAMEVAW